MQDNHSQTIRARNAIIALCAAFIIVIISISVAMSNILDNKNKAKIINESSNNANLVSAEDLERIRTELYDFMSTIYDMNSSSVDVAIRWDTVKTEGESDSRRTTMLADVDEYQQTYRINVNEYYVLFDCPELSETKYPNSFCIGNDGEMNDSIMVVFGEKVPYKGTTDNGVDFELSRNSLQPGDHGLKLWVYSCGEDIKAIQQANDEINNLIVSLGAPTELFEWDTHTLSCSGHGE